MKNMKLMSALIILSHSDKTKYILDPAQFKSKVCLKPLIKITTNK